MKSQAPRGSHSTVAFLTRVALFVIVALDPSCSLSLKNILKGKKHVSEYVYEVPDVKYEDAAREEVCFSKACVRAAADVLGNMDKSADPCEDFYQFACGSFLKNAVIPDDQSGVEVFSTIDNKLKGQLRTLVEEKLGNRTEIAPFSDLRTFYRSCMNKTRAEELGLKPLEDILAQLGGWPAVVGAKWKKESDFSWPHVIYKLRNLGFDNDPLFDMSVSQDARNSTRRILEFDQPSLGMKRALFSAGIDDPVVSAYHKFQVAFAKLLGADPEVAKRDMKEALLFEMALSNYSLPNEERRNYSQLTNQMTIKEAEGKWPCISWSEYVNQLLAPFHKIDGNEVVNIVVPSYFDEFCKHVLWTPQRTIANYLMWRVAFASSTYLSDDVAKLYTAFRTAKTGQPEQEPRWKYCLEQAVSPRGESSNAASTSYAVAMSSMYVRRYFDERARAAAVEMVQDIQEEFDRILDEIDWMDDLTKERAKTKSKMITPHIGYPVELLDDKKLINLYAGLEMDKSSFYQNSLKLGCFAANYSFKALREAVNKTSWTSHGYVSLVNAFYQPPENSIQFPAGILQGAFFGAERPKYMNYGAIGYVIGHEITHGFDDEGKQFDGEGNLQDWWESETSQKFQRKAECIVSQYGNYSVPDTDGLKVNGINTQGENIADNGGMKEAYRAYKRFVRRKGPEPSLPGLQEFSPQQLFWLSAANVYCEVTRPEAAKNQILTDSHPPGRFRVIGSLSNMEDFSKDFKCKPKSGMNPERKCSVW